MAANDQNVGSSEGVANDDVASKLDVGAEARALQLFQSELDLVSIVASRIARAIGSIADRDELLAAGREGLFDAARRFDQSRGIPFRAYANIRVQGAIMDSVRRSARLPRRAHERLKTLEAATNTSAGLAEFAFSNASKTTPLCDLEDRLFAEIAALTTATAMAVSTSSAGEETSNADADVAMNPEDATARAEMIQMVREAMSVLDGEELKIVQMYYFEDKSLRESAKELEVSQSWAVRLHARAIDRLTKQLRAAC